MLEPHISITAACLPCYGPLLEGGRSPESLVRSVRSIISLASRGSSSSNSKQRTAVCLDSNNDSQHEINLEGVNSKWSQQSQTNVQVSSGDEIELRDLENGINVTRGVEVVRE
ncbi:hypothetical protein GGS24DRAFT_481477 [Hypoxylon argillaceum]|nr:hypothetical protein GGS24DRAFT_481477 [Hypoxylon argillaceum]